MPRSFSEGQFGKQARDTFSVANDHARSIDSYMYWDFPDFLGRTFSLTMKLNRSVLSDSDGGSI